ncbi:hypothetical protein Btru_041109 [Bulinus truncatus]|nr:hypothetical protein Btru_041109 [Bulinus truncatus]
MTIAVVQRYGVAVKVPASDCKPLEENRPYSLMWPWRPNEHDRSKVALEKDGVIYATCYIDMTCVNYYDHVADTRITPYSDGSYLINLTIYNATRREVGKWVLKYVEGVQNHKSVVSKCYLKSYAYNWGITVYIGKLGIVLGYQTFEKNVSDIVHIHQTTWDNIYFNSLCQLQVHLHTTTTGSYSVDVSMFPDITGDDSDAQYGASTTTHFVKDGSSQLSVQYCDEEIDADSLNKTKVCLVKSRNDSYTTEAPSKPVVIEDKGHINGRCDIDTNGNEIVVQCSFVHTFPESFRCEIFLKKKEEQYLTIDGTLKTTELVSDTVFRHLSQCTFLVSGSYIEPGQYEATVIASEQNEQLSTGKNMSIFFDLDVKDTRQEADKPLTDKFIQLHYLFIPAIAGLIIIIVLFVLAFKFKIFCRLTTASGKSNHYEEINYNRPTPGFVREKIYINSSKCDDNNNNTLLETV